jgi:hypothetical protein
MSNKPFIAEAFGIAEAEALVYDKKRLLTYLADLTDGKTDGAPSVF